MNAILTEIELRQGRIMIFLVAVGFALRILGIGWDDWLQFHPDERNLVEASRALGFPDRLLPDFHAYNGLALYLPRLLVWSMPWASPDSATLTMAARLISALFGTALISFGGLIAARLGGTLAGLGAAALLAFSAPLIQWAHFGTTESAMALAVLALWWLALKLLDNKMSPMRAALWCGLVLGLALGLKTTAALFALIPLAALALAWPVQGRRLLWSLLAGAALSAAIFLTTTPSVLLNTHAYLDVMAFERGVVNGSLDVFWTWQFTGARDGAFELASLRHMLGSVMLVLAAFGLVLGLARNPAALAPAGLFAVVYCLIVFGLHAKFVRYLAPVVPLLLIFAALALPVLARLGSRFVAACVASLLLLAAVQGASMAASFLTLDPRIAASRFLQDHIAPGETIAREPSDVGAPLFNWERLDDLAVMEPTGPDKLGALSEQVARADWLVLNSRRHWAVLPRQRDRFPQMCGFYAALAAGDFGLQETARFGRWQPLRGLFYPGLDAEETLVVFDRPEVIVFRRSHRIDAAAAARAIEDRRADCREPQL